MKKIFLLLNILFISVSVFGNHIDVNTAKTVGKTFLDKDVPNSPAGGFEMLQLVYSGGSSQTSNGSDSEFYIFNAGSSCFVIVSGNDDVLPILGYSTSSAFDPQNIPHNFAKWLENYKAQVRYATENQISATQEINRQWQALEHSESIEQNRSSESVNPLLQTTWNQAPYYNAMCPGGSVTGCVATAMAQVMKYWDYPATGSGFHSYNNANYGTLSANFGSTNYDWTSMPNNVSSPNAAVATLMYQVGVSVDMQYSPQESNAYLISSGSPVTNCAEYALKTYFGYSPNLQGVQRSAYTDSQWINLVETELNAQRPVLYAGFGTGGGHCFVADGYDNNNFIHMNWGWGGQDNGYFQVDALNPGSLGIGGGDGGFNNGQQAIIGIQPPAGNQTYNLSLYDYINLSASTIYYGQAFTVTTNIANYGTNTFSGDYAAAVFDASYNFIDFIQTLSGSGDLPSNSAYTNDLQFSTTGLFSMLPGTYYVGIFYRPTGGNWVQVGDNGSYTNLVQISVINPNNIEMNSNMTVSTGNTITQGQAVSVNLNVQNVGTSTFTGMYDLSLYNLDGSFVETIQQMNENNGLPSGYTYNPPYLTFSTSSITAAPGTYLLALEYNPNNSGWQLVGSTYYQNPIQVTVVAATISPDMYEVNNTVGQSYNLPVNFSGNTAHPQTTGSNIHNTSDNDFYKINLPAGYSYSISQRLDDSYNSGNGNTYTADVLFSYSLDGTTWSQTYDDVMPGTLTIPNGGTVYYHVAPYFEGETGTYLLEMNITRSASSGLADINGENLVRVYPNPASSFVNVDYSELTQNVRSIEITATDGREISSILPNGQGTVQIPVEKFANGLYFLRFHTTDGIFTKKLLIQK